jgi:hypothetical protein
MLGWSAGDISGVVRVVCWDDREVVEGVDGGMADFAADSDRIMFCGDVDAYFVNKKLNRRKKYKFIGVIPKGRGKKYVRIFTA